MTKESNWENSQKSTGPRTRRGKGLSRLNAIKHGLYSKELLISQTEKVQFRKMQSDLAAQMRPENEIERLAFDQLVVASWRCKCAVRFEQRQWTQYFHDDQPENPQREAPKIDAVIERWYGSSKSDIRSGIRVLEFAMEEFEVSGYLHEETKNFLKTGFGSDLVPMLEEWRTMDMQTILMAEHLVAHVKDFADLPDMKPTLPEVRANMVIDPMQRRHMVIKLLETWKKFLVDVTIMRDRKTFERAQGESRSLDFSPRVVEEANREWRRALNYYRSLKEKNV